MSLKGRVKSYFLRTRSINLLCSKGKICHSLLITLLGNFSCHSFFSVCFWVSTKFLINENFLTSVGLLTVFIHRHHTNKFSCEDECICIIFLFFILFCEMIFHLQSVSSQQKANALGASFVYSPVGENLDWRLSATISSCHVTVIVFYLICILI